MTSTQQLLAQYAEILRELRDRNIIRTANAPAGDLAETLVARAYAGNLAPNSEKSWDIAAGDGRKLQVKARVIADHAIAKPVQFSVFRSWEFDAAVFVVLSAESYEVLAAIEVPSASVKGRSSESLWVRGNRITVGISALKQLTGAVDVTEKVKLAYSQLDVPLPMKPDS